MLEQNVDIDEGEYLGLLDVLYAAQQLEEYTPTSDNYIGGQCAHSQHKHGLALKLKQALKVFKRSEGTEHGDTHKV